MTNIAPGDTVRFEYKDLGTIQGRVVGCDTRSAFIAPDADYDLPASIRVPLRTVAKLG